MWEVEGRKLQGEGVGRVARVELDEMRPTLSSAPDLESRDTIEGVSFHASERARALR